MRRLPELVTRSAVAALGALLVATPAYAQVGAGDAALAQKLFEDGRALMAQKSYAEACPKLAESERLDPGVGTLLNLGECYEKSGKIASAWATYHEAEGRAIRDTQKKRAAFAASRAKALEPTLSYLVLDAPPDVTANVLVDGRAVGATSLGTSMPFDAGPHHLEATAVGRRAWSKDLDLAVRATVHVAIDLRLAPEAKAKAPVVSPLVATEKLAPNSEPHDGQTQRTLGLVAGSLGVVGIGFGAFFGLRAKSSNDEANQHCGPTSCDPTGGRLTSEARDRATASTALFIIGGVALAAGVVLYVTAPRTRQTARLDGFVF